MVLKLLKTNNELYVNICGGKEFSVSFVIDGISKINEAHKTAKLVVFDSTSIMLSYIWY
jgi:hypothetical protein